MNYCKEMSYGGCAFPAMFSKPRIPQARRIRSPNHYVLNSLIKTSGSHCSFGNTNLNVTVCRSPSYCTSTPIQSIGHFSWHVFKLKQIEPRSSFTCLARISLSLCLNPSPQSLNAYGCLLPSGWGLIERHHSFRCLRGMLLVDSNLTPITTSGSRSFLITCYDNTRRSLLLTFKS
jgi:hypothetical protein